jgi:3'-5' exoribonuclease
MTGRLKAIYDWLEPEVLREFLRITFSDSEFRQRFMTFPGSACHHHAWPGGLVYHSTVVAWRVFEALSHDRHHQGLATVAALLHDAGKTVTLTESGHLTDKGQNISHDTVTLELLADSLSWLDHRWPDGAITLRELLIEDRHRKKESYLRSLLRLHDRKSASLS